MTGITLRNLNGDTGRVCDIGVPPRLIAEVINPSR
jgi:hypothetical protein